MVMSTIWWQMWASVVEILQIEPGQTGKQDSQLKCPSRVGVVYVGWRREFALIFKLIFTMRFQGLDEKVPWWGAGRQVNIFSETGDSQETGRRRSKRLKHALGTGNQQKSNNTCEDPWGEEVAECSAFELASGLIRFWRSTRATDSIPWSITPTECGHHWYYYSSARPTLWSGILDQKKTVLWAAPCRSDQTFLQFELPLWIH